MSSLFLGLLKNSTDYIFLSVEIHYYEFFKVFTVLRMFIIQNLASSAVILLIGI